MISSVELAELFIKNSPRFYKDLELENVDKKHINILKESYKEVDKGSAFNIKKFRNWKSQSDMDVPAQLNLNEIEIFDAPYFLLKYLYKKTIKRNEKNYCYPLF